VAAAAATSLPAASGAGRSRTGASGIVAGSPPAPAAAEASRANAPATAAGASPARPAGRPLVAAFAPSAAANSFIAGLTPPALGAPRAFRDASGIHRSAQPPARPGAPGGTSPTSAGSAAGGTAGSGFGGAWAILLLELGLAGWALSVFLVAGGGRRPSSLVSLLERPG